MQFLENHSLLPFNTFHIEAKAKLFTRLSTENEIEELLLSSEFNQSNKRLWLGGGSNILFTDDFDGLVIKNEIKGIEVIHETSDEIIVKFGSGNDWHQMVLHCLENQWYGIENLSLIPGTIGAAPIQNIGAYGVELKDVFHELSCVHVSNGEEEIITKEKCEFGYRNSIFKNSLKNKVFIQSVTLKLSKIPRINISYRPLAEQFKNRKPEDISPSEVSDAVINIRKSKLPDPDEIGNGGSFFKNPIVDKALSNEISRQYPHVHLYENENGTIKIPAAFLIQECQWKGKRFGDAGVHTYQPLVLVNYKNAKGSEIVNLAEKIQISVFEKFHIKLEPEVNII